MNLEIKKKSDENYLVKLFKQYKIITDEDL